MASRLRLITFDVTGTLLLLRESVGNQYAKVGLRHGIDAPSDKLSANFYIIFKRLLNEHYSFGVHSIGWEKWWKLLVFQTFQNSLPTNYPLQNSTMDEIASDLIEVYKTDECWKLADGVENLLAGFKDKNIGLGVISNYDPRLKAILTNLNIEKYFYFVLTSYCAKFQKPDVEIFKIAEKMYSDLKKEEILHIGNSPELDFIGAKNAGWNALLVLEDIEKVHQRHPEIDRKWVVKNIDEIFPTLEEKGIL